MMTHKNAIFLTYPNIINLPSLNAVIIPVTTSTKISNKKYKQTPYYRIDKTIKSSTSILYLSAISAILINSS